MSDIEFESANIPVAVAAKALKMDSQTVRVLLQNKLVPWGSAFKRPGSNRFTYLISPLRFYEETGFRYEGGCHE